MDRLEGIKIFVRVVESGSFSAVAREYLDAFEPIHPILLRGMGHFTEE